MPRIEYALEVLSADSTHSARPDLPDPPSAPRSRASNTRSGAGPRHRAFAGVLLAVLGLLVGCSGAPPSAQTPALDKPVPVTLVGDDAAPAPIPVAGSRFVVLAFWSPTCEPCKKTIPAVLAKRAALEQKGAKLLHVAVLDKDQTANDAKATLALWGIEERFVIDAEGAYMRRLGAKDVPAFAIVDSAGVLRWVAPDGVTISNILAAIPE